MTVLTAAGLAASAKRNGVPEHLIDGLVRYVTHGYRPGSFLAAVLENNLMGAMWRADPDSRAGLFALCQVIDDHLPVECHGTPDRVAAWMDAGGLRQFDVSGEEARCESQ